MLGGDLTKNWDISHRAIIHPAICGPDLGHQECPGLGNTGWVCHNYRPHNVETVAGPRAPWLSLNIDSASTFDKQNIYTTQKILQPDIPPTGDRPPENILENVLTFD